MKQLLLICAVVALVGCGTKNPYWPLSSSPQNKPNLHLFAANIGDPIVEKAIREELKKAVGKLTKADLEKVTELGIYNKQLTSVKGLEKLTQLEVLSLRNNKLTDVKGLEKLTKLEELYLSDNKLTNVKGLEKLTKLGELDLGYNKLTDVTGLEKLTKLTRLTLSNNPDLTKAQIVELQKALPKCFIHSNPTK
jgi:Leucine-rich repeat (LRR) protein